MHHRYVLFPLLVAEVVAVFLGVFGNLFRVGLSEVEEEEVEGRR